VSWTGRSGGLIGISSISEGSLGGGGGIGRLFDTAVPSELLSRKVGFSANGFKYSGGNGGVKNALFGGEYDGISLPVGLVGGGRVGCDGYANVGGVLALRAPSRLNDLDKPNLDARVLLNTSLESLRSNKSRLSKVSTLSRLLSACIEYFENVIKSIKSLN